MSLIDQILKTQLDSQEPGSPFSRGEHSHQERHEAVDSLQRSEDVLEKPIAYQRWTLGLRSLVRLRYLDLKKRVLQDHRVQLKYDVSTRDVQLNVLDRLKSWCSDHAPWVYWFTPVYVYTLLAGLVVFGLVATHHIDKSRQTRFLFEHKLPLFSDTIYRHKAELARANPKDDILNVLTKDAETLREKILRHYEGLPAIQGALSGILDGVEANDVLATDLIAQANSFNDLLYGRGIPYYVSVLTETARCIDLPAEKFLSRVFGGASADEGAITDGAGGLCRVHALMTFHVDESRHYSDENLNHLAYFTRRLDQMDINQPFLGLVHIGDDSAQVLLSNIEGSSNNSLNAVNNGVLQSKLMPQGMPDVYGLESLARRLQSNVINAYVEDYQNRWWNRIPALWGELIGRPTSPLIEAADRLQKRVADVTAFHEVQHLVDQSIKLPEPEWFADTLSVFGKRVESDQMREHILWELSAFFTHLVHAEELQGVLLNEFTAITLNPMLQDQPHYYSIRILLPVLHQALKGNVDMPPQAARNLSDVALAYKALALNASDLDKLAIRAYPILFDRPLPNLREIRLPPKPISRFGD